jgi:hypothetical protein
VVWAFWTHLDDEATEVREIRAAPTAPANVRAVLADGTEVALECVYTGRRSDDGAHCWLATWVLPERPVSIRIDTLPAGTAVGIRYVASREETVTE